MILSPSTLTLAQHKKTIERAVELTLAQADEEQISSCFVLSQELTAATSILTTLQTGVDYALAALDELTKNNDVRLTASERNMQHWAAIGLNISSIGFFLECRYADLIAKGYVTADKAKTHINWLNETIVTFMRLSCGIDVRDDFAELKRRET